MNKATWRKKGVKRTQTGVWSYSRNSDRFSIELDSRDPVTGLRRIFTVSGDTPDFNGYIRDVE